jgi:hypothetical protein
MSQQDWLAEQSPLLLAVKLRVPLSLSLSLFLSLGIETS